MQKQVDCYNENHHIFLHNLQLQKICKIAHLQLKLHFQFFHLTINAFQLKIFKGLGIECSNNIYVRSLICEPKTFICRCIVLFKIYFILVILHLYSVIPDVSSIFQLFNAPNISEKLSFSSLFDRFA